MVAGPKWHIVGREGEEEDRGSIFHQATLPKMGHTIMG